LFPNLSRNAPQAIYDRQLGGPYRWNQPAQEANAHRDHDDP
jgi:hypothetical protein